MKIMKHILTLALVFVLPLAAQERTAALKDGSNVSSFAAQWRTAIAAQPTLVSGTSIKTLNGSSILGSGNIEVVVDNTSVNAAIATAPSAIIASLGLGTAATADSTAFSPSLVPLVGASGFYPEEVTSPLTTDAFILLSDSGNAVREGTIVWFNGAYRAIFDNALAADTGYPNTYESDIALWTTTQEPDTWTATSFSRVGYVLQATGTPGGPDRYGCGTPSACVIGNTLWVAYSGRGGANGSAPRTTCLASSTDGVTFTKHGAIPGSSTALDDDQELVHDPRTGRTYLYGTAFQAGTRTPVVWYTENTALASAAWTAHGVCTSETTTLLPYQIWIDSKTGIFWMVAGSSGDNIVFFSNDGLSFTKTALTVEASLHSMMVTDKHGTFWGWLTNDGGGLTVYLYRKIRPQDSSRIIVPLSYSTVSATGSFLFAPSRGIQRRISGVKFLVPTTIAASGSDYWTFEIKGRTPGSGTVSLGISGNTQAGVDSYSSISIPGVFTVAGTNSLQAYWTKTGTPANPVFLSLEYTEHP